MDDKNTKPSSAESIVEHRRKEPFSTLYANNVYLESSGWDVKFNFGELDQKLGPQVVMQHTAITLSWPQAKLLSYFLRLHLANHEAENGTIAVPKGVIALFPEHTPEDLAKLGLSQESYDAAREIYQDFVAQNPPSVIKKKEP